MELLTQTDLPSSVTELDDLASSLFTQYFAPKTPLISEDRRILMENYNLAAERRNKLSGFNALIKITRSTRIEFKEGDNVPGVGAVPLVKRPVSTIPTNGPVPVEGGNKIQQILALHDKGLTNAEIIKLGFNKSTVGRQVGEYKKRKLNSNG